MMEAGRPRKELNKEVFEELCKLQCTKVEICGVLKMDEKTLTKLCKENYQLGFVDTFAKYSQDGKASLRRHQFAMAEKNPTMAIWLGKQWLGQTDTQIIQDDRRNEQNSILRDIAEQIKEAN